jgi:hypothetical protein
MLTNKTYFVSLRAMPIKANPFDAEGDEDDWRGYFLAKQVCRVHRGSWSVNFLGVELGDSCKSEEEGFEICERYMGQIILMKGIGGI